MLLKTEQNFYCILSFWHSTDNFVGIQRDRGKKAQIDHFLIDSRHASSVVNVRSYRFWEPDIEHHQSDHFLLGAKFRARISNIGKQKGEKNRRYDVEKLKSEENHSHARLSKQDQMMMMQSFVVVLVDKR